MVLLPAKICLFKINNRKTRKRCEIFSKLTVKTPERRQRRRSGVFIVNFENILHLFLVFLLLTLNKKMLAGSDFVLLKTSKKTIKTKQYKKLTYTKQKNW